MLAPMDSAIKRKPLNKITLVLKHIFKALKFLMGTQKTIKLDAKTASIIKC